MAVFSLCPFSKVSVASLYMFINQCGMNKPGCAVWSADGGIGLIANGCDKQRGGL